MKQMRDEKADIFIFQAESSTKWNCPQRIRTEQRKEDWLSVKKKVGSDYILQQNTDMRRFDGDTFWKNALLGDFVAVRTSYSVLTQT